LLFRRRKDARLPPSEIEIETSRGRITICETGKRKKEKEKKRERKKRTGKRRKNSFVPEEHVEFFRESVTS